MAQKFSKLTKLSIKEVLFLVTLYKTPNLTILLEKEVSKRTLIKLRTFKRSTSCVHCDIQATHFWIECYKKITSAI